MLPAACIPALISLYTMQAYESTEIKHAFVVRMQAPGTVHHGHCILRVCIHYGRKGSAAVLEPKALYSTVIKERLALPVINYYYHYYYYYYYRYCCAAGYNYHQTHYTPGYHY
jgi:hypothetical protein